VIKRLLFLLSIFIFAGCSTTPRTELAASEIFEQWQFNGKFAIKTPHESQSAKINWVQLNDHYDINLYTTFGITVMKIKGDQQKVEITTDGAPMIGTSAEQLIWQLTRWHIPINQLKHWVKGNVVNASEPKFDDNGRFLQGYIIDSNGETWLLKLGKYKRIGSHSRPTTLRLSKDKMFLKLAISTWQIDK